MASTLTFPSITLLKNIVDPVDAQDAATKHYIDLAISSGGANVGAAGNINEIQFNKANTLGASANLTFDGNLITVIGNISTRNASLGNLVTANYITISNDANIAGTLTTANIIVGGNIIPNANISYNLGNNTNRFKDLWLSGNTINLGDATIKSDGTNVIFSTALGGTFTVNGTEQANSAYIVSGNSNVLVNLNSSVTVSAQGNANVVTVNGDGIVISGKLSTGDTTILGNLTVTGTTTSVNSVVTQIVDPIFELGGGANGAALTTDDNKDRGMLMHYYQGSAPVDAFMGWTSANSEFTFGSNVSIVDNTVIVNSLGNLRAGNASLGNLVTANYIDVTANITSGNASLGNLVTANYFAGTLITAAQPNITSVGNLTSLNIAGNITAENANLGNSVTANYFTINNGAVMPELTANSIIGNKAIVVVSSNTVIDTFTASKYRAAKYVIKASNDLGYQVLEAIIVHDNLDSYATIYGSISTTDNDIVEIDTYLVGSNIELKANATMTSANTTVRLLGTYIAD